MSSPGRLDYVSRGGVKLANALDAFGLEVSGVQALDVGASTGGFTDCLLQRGAAHVVAVDVAYGELDWGLRVDPRVTVIERTNARGLKAAALPYRPELIVVDVSFISLRKVLPALLACAARRFDALAMIKPQFEVGRELVGKGGVVRDADPRRRALVDVGRAAVDDLGAAVLGYASSGLPGPKGNRETFIWITEAGREGALERCRAPGGSGAGGRAVSPVRVASVLTHRRPDETAAAIHALIALAREHGIVLRFDPEETDKHGLRPGEGLELNAPITPDVDICFVLGGDGTILSALRLFAGTGVPVFAVNYGEIGFLATVDREEAEAGFLRAFAGDFDVLPLPGIELSGGRGQWVAINDVSMHRQPGKRVADLEYWVGADEIGRVRCDGLVVATPAGSTGYNLANGGPVMAWGVEGFVVSFIAPHSLTARALVVAPQDVLVIRNRSREEPVDVTVDGRPVCVLPPAEDIEARFRGDQGTLAQIGQTSFYQRLRQKFGRLASAP